MSDYYLMIKIQSTDRDLLDNLVVTLESVNNDLHGIKHVDVTLSDEAEIKQLELESAVLAQSCCQTEILERWTTTVEDLNY